MDNTRLTKAEEKFSLIFEQSPVAIILSKLPQTIFVEVNEAFIRMFEFCREDIIGKTNKEISFADPNDQTIVRELLRTQGCVKDYEGQGFTKSGQRITVLLNVNKVEIGGEPHLLTTMVDLTPQKKIEEQLRVASEEAIRANVAKSKFLASMSHEIRTPLSIIMGFSEMMNKPSMTIEDLQRYASRILHKSKHLKKLVDDVLDISKIEADKLELEKNLVSLPSLLNEEFASLRGFAEQKNLFFNVEFENIPSVITTDVTRLRQILNNIIGNAIKYTEVGGVTIKTKLLTNVANESRRLLEFIVIDTGVGISLKSQQRIFHPFTQADSSTLRKFGGTGLGLVISSKLAKAMGGNVHLVQSIENQGSTFVIQIDPGPENLNQISAQNSEAKIPSQTFSGLRVLSVEDNADIRMLLGSMLMYFGMVVEFAVDGEDGLKKAQLNHYDIVLMDVQMPKMNGVEATQTLRKLGYKKPIIAVTAHVLKNEYDQYLKSGFDACLSKPFATQSLLQVFESSLKRSNLS